MTLKPEKIPSRISPPHLCTPSRMAGERKMIGILRGLAASDSIHHVLDIGCGAGEYRFLFPGCSYLGIDIADHSYSLKKEPGIEFKVGNACRLPEDSSRFDLAFSSYAFEYFPDAGQALREIARVLAPRGAAVICLPAPPVKCYELVPQLLRKAGIPLGPVSAQPGIRHYSPGEFQKLAASSGLDMTDCVPVYGWATLTFKFITTAHRIVRHLTSRRANPVDAYPLYANRCVVAARDRNEWLKTLRLEESKQTPVDRLYVESGRLCMWLDRLAAGRPIAEYIAVFRKSSTAVATS